MKRARAEAQAEPVAGDAPTEYTCDICQNWRGDSALGLVQHRRRSLLCRQVECGNMIAVPAPQEEPLQACAPALQIRAKERQHAVVDLLTDLRVKKLVPGSHVQSMKDALSSQVLPIVQRHLEQELLPLVSCSRDDLRNIIARNTALFEGIETSSREHTQLLNREGFVRRS